MLHFWGDLTATLRQELAQCSVLHVREVRLTLSSPRVDSASRSGSPGVWMVTDLSPRLLLSLLFER